MLDSAIHSELLAAAAFVISLPGIALLTLGARRTRMIALPLAIGIFMLPIPAGAIAQLYLVLRKITAIATSHLVPLFGVPLARDGTMLTLPRSLVDVADNCSGFATMYAAILSSIVLAHLARSPVRQAAVLLRGGPARAGLQLRARHGARAPGPCLRLPCPRDRDPPARRACCCSSW